MCLLSVENLTSHFKKRISVNMFLTSFLLFSFLTKTNCFNIDTNFPIIYKDPQSENSSYFGYSVILYPGNKINAPWWVSQIFDIISNT